MWIEILLFALAESRHDFSATGVRLRVNLVMFINICEKPFTLNKSASAFLGPSFALHLSVFSGTSRCFLTDPSCRFEKVF